MTSNSAVPSADILMVIPNLDMGGAQRVFQAHAQLLAERYRVVEVAFNMTGGQSFPTGNPLLSLEVSGGGSVPTKVANLARRVAALKRIKRESGARLCISHMPGADYVNLLSRGGERTIAVVHGSKQGDLGSSSLVGLAQTRFLQPLLYRRADRVVTVSRDLASELSLAGVKRDKIVTINNFFDQPAICAAAKKPLAPNEQALFGELPVLVSTGRLHPQKNQLALLDLFAEFKRERPVRLLLLGDGELRDAMLQKADALGLSTWAAWRDGELRPDRELYLLGARDNPFQWLSQSDLFVFPSSWEGFPLALCEAMICGLPVLSADCPTGPREILAPESKHMRKPIEEAEFAPFGVLMPMLKEGFEGRTARQIWSFTLQRLLVDRAELSRLAQAGRQRMDDFTRERIGAQWFALVEEVLRTSLAQLR